MEKHRIPYDPSEHEPVPEGEETAPRLTRTMAVVRWTILGAMALFAGIMLLTYFGAAPPAGRSSEPAQYYCPMHPSYVSDRPGDCPICGMDLVPMDKPDNESRSGRGPATHESKDTSRTQGAAGSGLVPVDIEPRRLQLIDVRTATVRRRWLAENVNVVGFIAPDETRVTNLHLRFSGWVKEIGPGQTGQLVKKGERLFSVYSQELYQAEEDYLLARRALERGAADDDLTRTRRSLLDAARQRLELLGVAADELARLEAVGTPNSDIWVSSPSSGHVLQKNVFAGQYVGPGRSLLSIVDLSRVWVLADVYEQDIPSVGVGQKALMTTAAYEGETFAGRVEFVYPSVSEKTRTLKVRLEFLNPSMRLRPGMYAKVELEGRGKSALVVPVEAVMDDGRLQYVFVAHDGTRFEPRVVRVGKRTNDFVEVLSGLSEGEPIVTSANFLIDSESRLKAAVAGMGSTQSDAHAGHDG